MYMMAKHLHLTAVGLSILFFIFRFIWSQLDDNALSKKWVKIVGHELEGGHQPQFEVGNALVHGLWGGGAPLHGG